jgi:hypothetical protein
MNAVGGPHLSRKLKPTATIRGWSAQNMTRVRFTRKVEDYALARRGGKGQVGQIHPWCSIGGDGSLSPDSFRVPPVAHFFDGRRPTVASA